jgi:hypothetical protein
MTHTRRRRSIALLMLPLVLLLAGCVRFDGAFTISGNDQVEATILMAVQQQYANLVKEGCTQKSNATIPNGTVTTYKQDGYVGCTIHGSGMPMSAAKSKSTWSVTHLNGQYAFVLRNTNAKSGSGTMSGAMFTSFRVAVTFPGEVTSHSGSSTVEGTTVTWTDADDAFTGDGLKATSMEASPLQLWLPLGIGGAGLVLVGVIALVVWKRARTPEEVPHSSPANMLITPSSTWEKVAADELGSSHASRSQDAIEAQQRPPWSGNKNDPPK